ncbi:MAG: CBS domain-containing protein [Deltaproteobacteria bacterium]|nr:CBS domain-containing protein [Deltaproteobacteria bacterium]MBW2071387.1 CBS domain-containing protein [Deltaproteobacteria bacterium]
MLVKYWMTTDVITVTEDVSMMKASRLMKQHGIQHLPVMRNGDLVGIVSDRDLKEAQPSKATTLDIHELYYLLDQLKIKELVSKNLYTIPSTETVEKAAALMLKYDISALPVVDSQNTLQGIITKGDVFRAMVSISCIYQAPLQIGFEIEDRPGSIQKITDIIRSHSGRIVSIITNYEHAPEGFLHVYIRCKCAEDEHKLMEDLQGRFKVLYTTKDSIC